LEDGSVLHGVRSVNILNNSNHSKAGLNACLGQFCSCCWMLHLVMGFQGGSGAQIVTYVSMCVLLGGQYLLNNILYVS